MYMYMYVLIFAHIGFVYSNVYSIAKLIEIQSLSILCSIFISTIVSLFLYLYLYLYLYL